MSFLPWVDSRPRKESNMIELGKLFETNANVNTSLVVDPVYGKIQRVRKKMESGEPLKPESRVIKPCCYKEYFHIQNISKIHKYSKYLSLNVAICVFAASHY